MPPATTTITYSDGSTRTVPTEEAAAAAESSGGVIGEAPQARNSSALEHVGNMVASRLSGLSLGLSDIGIRKAAEFAASDPTAGDKWYQEHVEDYRKQHPWIHGANEMIGMAGGALATGGENAVAGGALRGAAEVGGEAAAKEAIGGITGAGLRAAASDAGIMKASSLVPSVGLSRVGRAAELAIERGAGEGAASSLGGRVLTSAARNAVEGAGMGAAMGATQAWNERALGDPNATSADLVTAAANAAGHGFLEGGVLGTFLGAGFGAAGKAVEALPGAAGKFRDKAAFQSSNPRKGLQAVEENLGPGIKPEDVSRATGPAYHEKGVGWSDSPEKKIAALESAQRDLLRKLAPGDAEGTAHSVLDAARPTFEALQGKEATRASGEELERHVREAMKAQFGARNMNTVAKAAAGDEEAIAALGGQGKVNEMAKNILDAAQATRKDFEQMMTWGRKENPPPGLDPNGVKRVFQKVVRATTDAAPSTELPVVADNLLTDAGKKFDAELWNKPAVKDLEVSGRDIIKPFQELEAEFGGNAELAGKNSKANTLLREKRNNLVRYLTGGQDMSTAEVEELLSPFSKTEQELLAKAKAGASMEDLLSHGVEYEAPQAAPKGKARGKAAPPPEPTLRQDIVDGIGKYYDKTMNKGALEKTVESLEKKYGAEVVKKEILAMGKEGLLELHPPHRPADYAAKDLARMPHITTIPGQPPTPMGWARLRPGAAEKINAPVGKEAPIGAEPAALKPTEKGAKQQARNQAAVDRLERLGFIANDPDGVYVLHDVTGAKTPFDAYRFNAKDVKKQGQFMGDSLFDKENPDSMVPAEVRAVRPVKKRLDEAILRKVADAAEVPYEDVVRMNAEYQDARVASDILRSDYQMKNGVNTAGDLTEAMLKRLDTTAAPEHAPVYIDPMHPVKMSDMFEQRNSFLKNGVDLSRPGSKENNLVSTLDKAIISHLPEGAQGEAAKMRDTYRMLSYEHRLLADQIAKERANLKIGLPETTALGAGGVAHAVGAGALRLARTRGWGIAADIADKVAKLELNVKQARLIEASNIAAFVAGKPDKAQVAPKLPPATVEKLTQTAAWAATNPELMQQVTTNLAGELEDHAPETARAMANQYGTALNYLAQKTREIYPPQPQSAFSMAIPPPPPSAMQTAQRDAIVRGLMQPSALAGDVAAGRVTKDQIDAMRAVYPQKLASVTQAFFNSVTDMRQPATYQQRLALANLFGPTAEPTIAPEFLQHVQEMFARKAEQQSAPTGMGSSKLDSRALIQPMLTQTQQLSTRKR